MESKMTKMLLATAAFTIALASPAFAQSFDPDIGTGNIVPPAAQYAPRYHWTGPNYIAPAYGGAFGAYAQEPAWNGLPQGPVVPDDSGRRTRTSPRR
jgi:hypothetical protein